MRADEPDERSTESPGGPDSTTVSDTPAAPTTEAAEAPRPKRRTGRGRWIVVNVVIGVTTVLLVVWMIRGRTV